MHSWFPGTMCVGTRRCSRFAMFSGLDHGQSGCYGVGLWQSEAYVAQAKSVNGAVWGARPSAPQISGSQTQSKSVRWKAEAPMATASVRWKAKAPMATAMVVLITAITAITATTRWRGNSDRFIFDKKIEELEILSRHVYLSNENDKQESDGDPWHVS